MAFRQERSSSPRRGASSGRPSGGRGAGAGRGRSEGGRGRGGADSRDGAGRPSYGRASSEEQRSRTVTGRGGRPLGPKSRGRVAEPGTERNSERAESRTESVRGTERRGSSFGRVPEQGDRSDRGGRGARGGPRKRFAKTSGDTRVAFSAGQTPGSEAVEEGANASLIVGRHPVLEALKSGRSINKIMVAQTAEGGSLPEIVGKAKSLGVVVQTVPKAHLDEIAAGQNHQGIAAYAAAHDYVEFDDLVARVTGHPPLVVLLDEVADPYNLGAILRTAEATGVQGVVIPKRRAVPLTETVGKAAAGAMEYVPVARVANLVQAIDQLKKAGFWIVGTDVDATHGYTEVDYKGPIAIVIGAEGKGLSRLVKEHCDYTVSLPMLGNLQSLNASVAAGVLLYEVVRQRK